MHPMKTAPRDGSEIEIKARGRGWVRAYYLDCAWLREECPETKEPGDKTIRDCWRIADSNGDDVELIDAREWRPVTK